MLRFFDTHTHLDQSDFDADRADVLTRARQAGVDGMICVGTTAETSAAAVELAQREPDLYAAVGLQPNSADHLTDAQWDRVVALARQPRVVALGETGLDRYWDFTPFALQIAYFDRHLALAQAVDLPVLIHSREADADLLEVLRAATTRGPLRGLLHAFGGSAETAAACVDMGLYISFAGNVSYTNKKFESLRAVAAGIPAERLLVETDCPYLTPHPLRGKQRRNEPALVVHTAAALAALRGVAIDELADQTTANARRLFRLEKP